MSTAQEMGINALVRPCNRPRWGTWLYLLYHPPPPLQGQCIQAILGIYKSNYGGVMIEYNCIDLIYGWIILELTLNLCKNQTRTGVQKKGPIFE